MVSKIESIITDRLSGCSQCSEPYPESTKNLHAHISYGHYLNICRTDKGVNKWAEIYKKMCKEIESEKDSTYRVLRSILHKFSIVKDSELIYLDIKNDYQTGKLKEKYTDNYRKDIIRLEKQIKEIEDIPDRDLFIHTCKNYNVYQNGNPEEGLKILGEICKQQTGKDLNEMIEKAS